MKARFSKDPMSAETIVEASRWFVEFRLAELDNETRERFMDWLRASPAHIRAYIEIAGTYAEMAPPNAQAHLDIEKLLAEARAEESVVELPRIATSDPRRPQKLASQRRSGAKALWALAASATLAILGGAFWYATADDTYQTQMGEQRSLTLADGSRVDLNARSKVRIRIGREERRVELLTGQALFHVTRDVRRPFLVDAAGTTIRAVGTSFDVNRGRSATTVTVLEGKVAVSSPMPGVGEKAEGLLSAGEQLRVSAGRRSVPKPVNVKAATAWTQHQLVFESTPLQDVVEQFNRYNTRQLVIDGRALETFHVSGYYATPDPTSLLNFLRSEPQIEVLETEDSIHISRK